MSCTISLHPDNSLRFEATLTNPNETPIYVNDATVAVTVYDDAGVEVTGQVWPLTLAYEAASDGVYSASVDPITGISAGMKYNVILLATGATGLVGQWNHKTTATYRGCD